MEISNSCHGQLDAPTFYRKSTEVGVRPGEFLVICEASKKNDILNSYNWRYITTKKSTGEVNDDDDDDADRGPGRLACGCLGADVLENSIGRYSLMPLAHLVCGPYRLQPPHTPPPHPGGAGSHT